LKLGNFAKQPQRALRFSALKKSGSIEADGFSRVPPELAAFSALKKSGSIEAKTRYATDANNHPIFRFEKKRLH